MNSELKMALARRAMDTMMMTAEQSCRACIKKNDRLVAEARLKALQDANRILTMIEEDD